MDAYADEYLTLSQEQGLCRVGDIIINLGKTSMILKTEGRTLVYRPGAADPVALPASVFDAVKDAVFAIDADEYDDDDEEFEEDGE
jgi:hypothetical protein